MPAILPSNIDAEIGVIGSCLLGGLDTATEVVEVLKSRMFTHPDCEQAFSVLEGMVGRGDRIDLVTFGQAWAAQLGKRDIPLEILASPDKTPCASHATTHAGVILECHRRRKLVYAGHDLQNSASDFSLGVDELIAKAEAEMGNEEMASVELVSGSECSRKLVDYLEHRFNLQGKRSGLVTHLGKFDYLTDGLQFGEQTIIAARPSMGKTAIGLNIVEQVCLKDGHPTLFISLEMSTQALMRRLLSSQGNIPMNKLRDGTLTEEHFRKFTMFTGLLKRQPLHVIEGVSGLDCSRLSAAVRRAVRKHGIKLVVIDYLQKIKPSQKQEKRTYEVGEVSGVLKALAVQTNVAMVTLAQLNRESEKDKGRLPKLSDLADSGQIERDADTVALLHRNRAAEDGGTRAQLIVAKQRDGEVGVVDLDFDGQFCRFQTPSFGHDVPDPD